MRKSRKLRPEKCEILKKFVRKNVKFTKSSSRKMLKLATKPAILLA